MAQLNSHGSEIDHKGDVTGLRIIRNVEQHPDSWRIWQPTILHWRKQHLVVAFGAMINGKKDMGDIFAMVSRNDGDTWGEAVAIFDHDVRHGAIQFAYANPVLFLQPLLLMHLLQPDSCPLKIPGLQDNHSKPRETERWQN